jgi:hypothetical protein
MEGRVGVATLTSGWASATTNLPLQGQSVRDPLGEFRHHLHLLIHGRSCGIPSCSITLVPLPLLTSFLNATHSAAAKREASSAVSQFSLHLTWLLNFVFSARVLE